MNVSENGWWLLARLAVHHHYNRRLRVGFQDPLWGVELNAVDRLEVARLALALADARNPYRVTGNEIVYMRRER
jgi:hypothetical protein